MMCGKNALSFIKIAKVNINFCTSTVVLCHCSTDCHIKNRLLCLCAWPPSFKLCYNPHVHDPILCFLLTNQSAVLLGQNVSICCVCACCVWASVCSRVYKCPLWSQGFVCMCACMWNDRGNPWKVKLNKAGGGYKGGGGQKKTTGVVYMRRGGEVCSRGQSFSDVTQR